MSVEGPRVTFTSSRGAVLAAAGVAIGLGNIWRFPYTMGESGGAAFLLVYVVIVVAFGIPALMAELALGRHTGHGPLDALRASGLRGASVLGWVLVITVVMAVSLYNVAVGWTLYFAAGYARAGLGGDGRPSFGVLMDAPMLQYACTLLGIGLSRGALAFGVQRGIERSSKILMPLFALLFVVLIVRVLTLDGAGAGLRHLLVPDLSRFDGRTMLAAVGQAVFSLGLGGTMMVVYGSYVRPEENLPRQAALVAGADLTAALLAGLLVVPAATVFSIELASGPPLMFDVMPGVFGHLAAGELFAFMFFVAVLVVSMLSVMAAFEVIVVTLGRSFGMRRGPALVVILVSQSLLVIPAIVSVGYFGLSDRLWITTLMPFGSIVAVVALAWSIGRAATLEELRRGGTLPVPTWLHLWLKYAIPVTIGGTLVYGWVEILTAP